MKILLSVLITFSLTLSCVGQTVDEAAEPKNQSLDWKSEVAQADQLMIDVQKICPVSGAVLGSSGKPVKIKAGEQVAFLCCGECQKKRISIKHWTKIQERIAKAQGICPIMDKPVDAKMESTIVNGQKIFVCCPPCIKQIQDDPKKSIEKLKSRYVSFVVAEKQKESDETHLMAQKICPVSGKKLSSIETAVKVKVGEKEHAFLCCKACVEKPLKSEFWRTIQTNLATAQGVCPIMQQPVDASMDSTVVRGRKIFVCCPPCIKKIEDQPDVFVERLNQLVKESLSATR